VPAALIPATLSFKHQGVPWSETFDDVYHSAAGGVAQARHVFLDGNGLPGRWAGRERFVILETGFGAGINFLATWQAWRQDAAGCARLHFVSIEKHPFALHDLREIHSHCPQIADEAAELHAHWPMLVPGAHRIELDAGKVVLTLFFADIKVARELRLAADAFYLDGFAPAKNPDMWSPALMRSLSRLAAPGATAATWSVASSVRHAFEETGFAVEKRPGFGDKREMLFARFAKPVPQLRIPKTRKASVIGAGLAGAAVCERLCARGWEVTLLERHDAPAQEASGNLAGTFHPLVTPDDSIFARLTRAAFLYSTNYWQGLEDLRWDRCGVLQLARDEKEQASQRRSLAALQLPPEYAQYVTREEASAHAGVPLAADGLWFPQGGWIQPRSLVEAQLRACGDRLERRYGIEVADLPDGIVVLANSSEAPKLQRVPHLRLRKVRGQLTYVPAESIEAPHVVVLRGGMLLPPVDGVCVAGATYDIDDEDPRVRADSHASNLARVGHIIGQSLDVNLSEGRVAFRAVVPDRLPVVGRIEEGRYAAFAYGSRGLVWSALAAELIAAELEGEPLPLEGALVDAMRPGRFAERSAKRGGREPVPGPGSPNPLEQA
jgi:tRNA 5-methylaminomethyl-2-thiouridine biosynthesis bifunctional protein